MKEDFVQAIWKYQLFNTKILINESGQTIQVQYPGFQHQNSGPDFTHARLFIDNILWVGNIEIHTKSSEWYHHNHHVDPAYNNVILHVVFEDDLKSCFTENNFLLNTLVIKHYVDDAILDRYSNLVEDLRQLPCRTWWNKLEQENINHWLTRMSLERFELKANQYKIRLAHLNDHWDQLFLELVARQMGFHVNAEPMEQLAMNIKIEWVQKLVDQPEAIEAIFFGQAGMLDRSFNDLYPQNLKKEYRFQKLKFNISPIAIESWKFSRMRPNNFPTIRIAQLAAIIANNPRFFTNCLDLENVKEIQSFFCVQPNEYWNTHYVFDKVSNKSSKVLGAESIDQLILNTLCYLWFLYGKIKSDTYYIDKAIHLMEELKPENNRFVNVFSVCNFSPRNSLQSQGLRYLWENYCDEKKCLTCSIGIHGLKLEL